MPRLTVVAFVLLLLAPPALASDFNVPLGQTTTVELPLGFKLACPHIKLVTGFDEGVIAVDPMSPSKKPTLAVTGLALGSTTIHVTLEGTPACPGFFADSYSVSVTPDEQTLRAAVDELVGDVLKDQKADDKAALKQAKGAFKALLKNAKKSPPSPEDFLDDAFDIFGDCLADLDDALIDGAGDVHDGLLDTFSLLDLDDLGDFGSANTPGELLLGGGGPLDAARDGLLGMYTDSVGDLDGLLGQTLDKGEKVIEGFDYVVAGDSYEVRARQTIEALFGRAAWNSATPVDPRPTAMFTYARVCVPGSQGARIFGHRGDFSGLELELRQTAGPDLLVDIPDVEGGRFDITLGDALGDEESLGAGLASGANTLIFADGFESGDTSRWTSQVP